VILGALSGGSGRAVVARALRDLEVYEGLGTTYRLATTGELAYPKDGVGVSELRAGRWVRLEPST
jgi:hypothetical protein